MLEKSGQSLARSLFILCACLVLIILIDSFFPRLWPYHFPRPWDKALMALAVLGSVIAAGYSRTRLIFLLYGAVAGWLFMEKMLFSGFGVGGPDYYFNYPQGTEWFIIRECCIMVVGMMLACLYAAVLRHRWPQIQVWWVKWRTPPEGHCRNCGYNLTGNVSGICPECGERI
jgi:hypothetical protein